MNKKILKLEYIYGIILIIFLYFLFLYPQDFKSLVVGSYSSVQLIQTQKYIIDFIDNLNYPFVFNLANGFDLIADSPQSVLHPLYVVINFFLDDKIILQSIFVKIHMFFFILGLYFYLKDKINNNIISIILIFSISNSMAFTENISHPFFISVYCYFPFILIMVDKIILNSKRLEFIFFTLLLTLMLLVGHFQHQFIFLCFLMVYLVQKLIVKKINFRKFIDIIFCIMISFIIALPQLLPVFDLMLTGERSNIGGIGRFSQSLSGLGITGYLFPGFNLTFFKYFQDHYNLFSTAPSLVEGLHYIGILPLVIFSFFLTKINKDLFKDAIFISIIFLFLRALGIFFILNLFLNYLPLFGQFRAPIRNLYLVDFLIFIFIAINFKKYFLISDLRNFVYKFYKYYIFLILSIFLIAMFFGFENVLKIEIEDYFVMIFSFIILTLIVISFKYFKKDKHLYYFLLIFALIDISFYKYVTPSHSKILKFDEANKQVQYYDNFCKTENVNNLVALFDHSILKNDLPRFNYGEKEYKNFSLTKNDYNNRISPSGRYVVSYNCDISLSVKILTLSSYNLNKFNNMFYINNNFTLEDKVYVSNLLGFEKFITYEKNNLKIVNKDLLIGYNKEKINHILNSEFLNNNNLKKGLFGNSFNIFVFESLNSLNLKNLLKNKIVEVNKIDNTTFIPYGSSRNFVIINDQKKLVNFSIKDPFIEVDTNNKTVKIVYVPSPFLVGLILIIPLVILVFLLKGILIFLFKNFNSKIGKFIENFNDKIIKNIKKNKYKISKLSQKTIYLQIPLIIFCFTYLILLGFLEIELNNKTQNTIQMSSFFFFHFLVTIYFSIKILYTKKNLLVFNYFTSFIILNILLGMVLWSELTIYETPKYLVDNFGFEKERILKMKIFISNFW